MWFILETLFTPPFTPPRRAGARFLLLNCTPGLAPLYEAKGWVRYKPAAWDESMGLQVVVLIISRAAIVVIIVSKW